MLTIELTPDRAVEGPVVSLPEPEVAPTFSFLSYLKEIEEAPLRVEDLVAAFLPLVEQTLETHERDRVAPLDGPHGIKVTRNRLWFHDSQARAPRRNEARLDRVQAFARQPVEVVEILFEKENRLILRPDQEVRHPSFVSQYHSWENLIGHHDPLSDVAALGFILASLALRRDFMNHEAFAEFVQRRHNLFALEPGVHPAIQKLILRLTEPDRQRRVQDLHEVVDFLRDFRSGRGVSWSGWQGAATTRGDREGAILERLRSRLFDTSKRNRLIYFQPHGLSLNLTDHSVPQLMAHQNLDPAQVLMWQPDVERQLGEGRSLCLNRYFETATSGSALKSLTAIRQGANRDEKEYGFTTLRLVIAFLHWHNLRDEGAKDEKIHSPLLMLPVRLNTERGVRDRFELEPLGHEAEVNPALRHYLQLLYGLELPEKLDLVPGAVETFFLNLKNRIEQSAPEVMLEKRDRPAIRLHRERARRRAAQDAGLERLSGEGVRRYREVDYSYTASPAEPLGLRLFQSYVRPSALPMEYGEYLRESYEMVPELEGNPYCWVFDLCGLTLGCFEDQKMTLVHDYDALLAGNRSHPALQELFTTGTQPRDLAAPALPLQDQFLIAPADPTQVSAIALARTGRNLIIQGPPGTGKSQTITNLIADYVARGKRVLFVCEKRAALDVVYSRLAQARLDRQAILIHDSQRDRKPFVLDLKSSYESFFEAVDGAREGDRGRGDLVETMLPVLRELEGYARAVQLPNPDAERSPLQLMERFVDLRRHAEDLGREREDWLPAYGEWLHHGSAVEEVADLLAELGERRALAAHPLRFLSAGCLHGEIAVPEIRAALLERADAIGQLAALLREQTFDMRDVPLRDLPPLIEVASRSHFLAVHDLLGLLQPESFESRRLVDQECELREAQHRLEELAGHTASWRFKLPQREASRALLAARFLSEARWPWLSPGFWRLRRVLRVAYDFSAHEVRPEWEQILTDLLEEYEEQRKMAEIAAQVEREFRVPRSADLLHSVREMRELQARLPFSLRVKELMHFLSRGADARDTITGLHLAGQPLGVLQGLEAYFPEYLNWSVEHLRAVHSAVLDRLHQLPGLVPGLRALAAAPEAFYHAVRNLDLEPESLEAAMARKTLVEQLRLDRKLRRFDGSAYRRDCARLAEIYGLWLGGNSSRVVERGRRAFQELHEAVALGRAEEGDRDARVRRERFAAGCAALEHQFRLTQRFHSIREIASESREAIMALKPVWLMSPLSISQTLPLDSDLFDVVIFDEASQIRLEDAVPSIYRGKQVIVVGDEMQLPPTSFFSTGSLGGEDWVGYRDGSGNVRHYPLDADSLLSHAAQRLPSTLLGWHYRSRSEALISFSNHAFYRGELLTIPECGTGVRDADPIVVKDSGVAREALEAAMQRSVSFHRMEQGTYVNRRNKDEARYLASLVRELLRRQRDMADKDRLSLGVVAFSDSQQDAIERALEQLAREDRDFDQLLAEERERVIDGQLAGLFVKNLENVQGDERDIILLSVCYGPDERGKMKMGFGPINQQGGEKRLNVILSRARKHMMVVSSIEHHAITNDWNHGARCLKRFLEYAAAVSVGDEGTARRVLASLRTGAGEEVEAAEVPATVRTLAEALRERGIEVETQVGQSKFKIDLALRRPGDRGFSLGILIDSEERYEVSDPLERSVLRPGILRAFGWKLFEVLSKDWYDDPERVLEQIEKEMGSRP